MNKHSTRLLTGLIGTAALATAAHTSAGENMWVYAKGTDTRPQGSWEFKLSDTIRVGKDGNDYVFHDIRPEIEYGVTDKFTIGAEIMIFDHNYSLDDEINPMFETQGGEGGSYNKTQYGGFELTTKYNVLSPYKDMMGLSFGISYENRDQYRLDGADIDQDSFVFTTFTQWNWLDDTLTLVITPKVEFERRKSPGVLEEEFALDVAAGLTYRVAPKWFAGMEFRSQSDYLNPQEEGEFDPDLDRSSADLTDVRIGTRHQYGNYFGPNIHYAEKEWWATVGALYQVSGGGSEHAYNNNGKNWDEHEKWHIGLSYGLEF